jgi:hypothetical protein
MSLKTLSLALILVLTSAWTHDQQARTHLIDLPRGVSPFEQVFTILAIQNRAELRHQTESPSQTLTDIVIPSLQSDILIPLELLRHSKGHRVMLSGDLCYLLMSIQQ